MKLDGLIFLLAACSSISIICVECPNPSSLPLMISNDRLLCAQSWENSYPTAINSCTGFSHVYGDFNSSSSYNPAPFLASLVVRPGCVFHAWSWLGSDTEDYHQYTGVVVQTENPIKRYKCRCGLEPVACKPTDQFVTVMSCDATNAASDSECSYTKSTGRKYSESVANATSIDSSINVGFQLEFKNILSVGIGISKTTGYNWTQERSVAFEEMVIWKVKATVKAGMVLTIDQAIGNCDGTAFHTEKMRIFHTQNGSAIAAENEITENDLQSIPY